MEHELTPVDRAGRLRAGSATRVLVDRTGLKHLAVARRLGWDKTKLSKSLSGTRGLTASDAADLDTFLSERLDDHPPGAVHDLWFVSSADTTEEPEVTEEPETTAATAPVDSDLAPTASRGDLGRTPPAPAATRHTEVHEAPQGSNSGRPTRAPAVLLMLLVVPAAVVLGAVSLLLVPNSDDDTPPETAVTVLGTTTRASDPPPGNDRSACGEAWPGLPQGNRRAEVADAIISEADRSGLDTDGMCLAGSPVKREEVYWQSVVTDAGRPAGGIIAFEDRGEPTAVYLNYGQWQSYIRIGGGDGSRSPAMAGLPSGTTTVVNGRYWMELTGDVGLVAEAEDGTYYWLPTPAADTWEDEGAADGPLGYPTSSPYLSPSGLRQDFEYGHLVLQTTTGTLDVVLADPAPTLSDAGSDIVGTLVSAADGTGWFVGTDRRRWWVPDPATWSCLGGETNQSFAQLTGGEVHLLAYGGVATCPASPEMGWPAGYSLDLNQYCSATLEPGATSQLVGDEWNCISPDGATTVLITADEACRWQYGPAAEASTTPGEPYSWACG
jgi:hypothetical protein